MTGKVPVESSSWQRDLPQG